MPLDKQKYFHKIIGINENDKKIKLFIFFFICLCEILIKKVTKNNISSKAIPSFLINVKITKKQKAIK